MPTFPEVLDDFTPKTDGVDDVMAIDVNELQTAIEAIEAKLGIDSSVDTDSIDYKVANKQDTLVSGTNIKTINSTSLLGSGDLAITVPVKATGSEIDTGTDDAKFATAKAIKDSHNVPSVAPGTSGNVLTSDGTDWTSAAPSGGTSLWTAFSGTRASNTTITVSGDVTATFKKGMIIKWTDTTTHVGMVSIPSTESGGTTTITIIGDVCSADATDFSYCLLPVEKVRFAVAGNIGAVADDVANAYYATEPMRVLGADLQVGTAGTTNSTTIDIDKATTTMFTTKPTLATTVASSPTPFTADDNTSLALGDRVRINIDAVQTTAAVDLYVQLYVFSSRLLTLE